MSRQKVTLRIDRVVVDDPGLSREALADALHGELRAALAAQGPAIFGQSRAVEALRATARPAKHAGESGPARSVASATVRALRS